MLESDEPNVKKWQGLVRCTAKLCTRENGTKKPQGPSPEEVLSSKMEEVKQYVRDNTTIRIVGYPKNARKRMDDKDLESDIRKNVQCVEERELVQPAELSHELQEFPEAFKRANHRLEDLDPKEFPFIFEGGHVSINAIQTLMRVRREGAILIAELNLPDGGTIPLGYCYAFDSIPRRKDQGFPNLAMTTLQADSVMMENIRSDPEKLMVIWRTSVARKLDWDDLQRLDVDLGSDKDVWKQGAEVTRRIGIASALKYVMCQQSMIRGRTMITLNIARMRLPGEKSSDLDRGVQLTNVPSERHNGAFLERWGVREHVDKICVPESVDKNQPCLAQAQWWSWGNFLPKAVDNLGADGAVLNRKGWDKESLDRVALSVAKKIKKEKHDGIHSGHLLKEEKN